jgi:hypothetical protein
MMSQHQQEYGWNGGGNCLWCGESGRCHCDHSRQVEESANRLRAYPEMHDLLRFVADIVPSEMVVVYQGQKSHLGTLVEETIAKAEGNA